MNLSTIFRYRYTHVSRLKIQCILPCNYNEDHAIRYK